MPRGEKSAKREKSYIQLGNKIKGLRKKHNLTQTSLSQQLGVTSTYIALIEQGKRGGADEFLIKVEDFFKLKNRTLLKLRDAQNTDRIQEEKPKPDLELEHKTIPKQYPAFIQNLVDTLLSYGEGYAKQKVPTWIKELQDEFFNQLTPFELDDVKQHVMAVKRNWVEVKKKKQNSARRHTNHSWLISSWMNKNISFLFN